ncbi:MAG: hypothetical protein K2I45_03535 [Muribaculaceae bacterium]|nr:hypothetical protein [Muribaculaceae bacterium]
MVNLCLTVENNHNLLYKHNLEIK